MKYCVECGHQAYDNSMFCTACGTKFKDEAPIVECKNSENSNQTSEFKLLTIFNFVHNIFSVLGVMGVLLSLAMPYLNLYVNYNRYYDSIYSSGTIYYEEEAASFAIVMAAMALSFSIPILVLTIVKKQGLNKIFSAITRIVISIAILVVGIVLVNY